MKVNVAFFVLLMEEVSDLTMISLILLEAGRY